MKNKKNELDVLLKARKKCEDVRAFTAWLKKKRSVSIKVGESGPLALYKRGNLYIESDDDIEKAKELSGLISNTREQLTSSQIKTLRSIIKRLDEKVAEFQKSKHKEYVKDYKFLHDEIQLLSNRDNDTLAKYILGFLSDGDVPYNDDTKRLYEDLISLDNHFVGEDRLIQRRLLAYSIRGVEYPPIYADENLSLVHEGKRIPFSSLAPNDIDNLCRKRMDNDTKMAPAKGWSVLLKISSRDSFGNKVINYKHVFSYNPAGVCLGELSAPEDCKFLQSLFATRNLANGLTPKELMKNKNTSGASTHCRRINKLYKELIIREDTNGKNTKYKINPSIKILMADFDS